MKYLVGWEMWDVSGKKGQGQKDEPTMTMFFFLAGSVACMLGWSWCSAGSIDKAELISAALSRSVEVLVVRS